VKGSGKVIRTIGFQLSASWAKLPAPPPISKPSHVAVSSPEPTVRSFVYSRLPQPLETNRADPQPPGQVSGTGSRL
jgi:hypothetical protein